jgi:hypothetical protein
MYMIYIRWRCCFSLVYTSKKVIIVLEVKANVQKGALRLREERIT